MSFTFNAADVELNSFEPLPPGDYQVMVTKAEVKPSKSGDCSNLSLELAVINNPEFGGRKLFDRITYGYRDSQKNKKSDQILKILCVAVGFGDRRITSEQDFVGSSLKVSVTQEQHEVYGLRNNIKGRYPV